MPIEKMKEVPYPGLVPYYALRKKLNEIIDALGEVGGAAWGDITGNLPDQEDLADALDGKVNVIYGTTEPLASTPGKIGDIYASITENGDAKTGKLFMLFDIDATNPEDIYYAWVAIPRSISIGNNDTPISTDRMLGVGLRTPFDSIKGELTVVGGGSSVAIAGIPLCPYSVGTVLHVPILDNSGTGVKEFTVDVSTPNSLPYYDGDQVDTCSLTMSRITARITY